jgi:hypothetical protein
MSKTYDNHPKILLVEGKEDARVIPELMEANGVEWVVNKIPVVYIKDNDGYENLVDPDVISSELQASNLSALGIIIDADDNLSGRWESIRNASLESIPNIPRDLPEAGLIHIAPNGVRFGIWIMPDNKISGMLETFLTYMIPENNEVVWQFAQEVTQDAKNRGAVFKDTHVDKAEIYTWLAWQNPPGRQLHQAIMERILNPQHPEAQVFITWFKNLYDLN